MKNKILVIFIILNHQIYSQNNIYDGFLYRICNDDYDCGYVNRKGDTIISIGKYLFCYTDSIKEFGIVFKDGVGFIGINKDDSFLFEIFMFDNGPDPVSEGLFRIVDEHRNIGYADSTGRIIIAQKYKCAFPFIENKAKVSFHCRRIKVDEYGYWVSRKWFYIDKKGKIINSQKIKDKNY